MTTSHFALLYVCNNNSARSPLSAACTQKLVSKNGDVRWTISSAGTEAAAGEPVSTEAHHAAGTLSLDLADHSSSLLTAEHCAAADLVLAMSWEQVSHIWSLAPDAYEKVFTLKEFVHWAQRAPSRPPILFSSKIEHMRDKVAQAHTVRKRARADHGFWGGIRPQDLNLIEPIGKGDEAWEILARAVHALTSDIITLLAGAEDKPRARRSTSGSRPRRRAKARR